MKLSKPERAAVALTAACLLFFTGWLGRGLVTPGWYAISGSHPAVITPSPAPRQVFLPDQPLDLNAATFDDLCGLPRIGARKAQDILDYRAEHGPFAHPEDLLNVPGIGPGVLEALLPYVTAIQP